MNKILWWRRFCQISIVLFFVIVPILNLYGMHQITGNFLAFNAFGIHIIDPLSALQVFLGTFSFTSEMFVGASLVLVIAFFMGSIFCAWICPYGLFSELCFQLSSRCKRMSMDTKKVVKISPIRISVKISIVGVFCLCLLIFPLGYMGLILNQLSLPAWYSRIWQVSILSAEILWGAIGFILIILLAEIILKKRFWCMYFCPQSVMISLVGFIFPYRLRIWFVGKNCTCNSSNRMCVKKCSLGLNPRKLIRSEQILCINCGDCIDACQEVCTSQQKALSFMCGKDKR